MDSCTSSATHATCSHLYTTRRLREEGEICVGLRATSVGVIAPPHHRSGRTVLLEMRRPGLRADLGGGGGQVLAKPGL